ncbi:hypothetical protein quinque_003231 [Culex quinquefasciatus]
MRRLPRDLLWAACCPYYVVSKSCVESSVEDVGTRIGSMVGRSAPHSRAAEEINLHNAMVSEALSIATTTVLAF